MSIQDMMSRARALRRETQRDALGSVVAAAAVAAVPLLLFPGGMSPWYYVAQAGTMIWAVLAVVAHRRLIWPGERPADALAASGVEYYRATLMERRTYLSRAWLWRGPIVAALTLVIAPLFSRAPALDKLAPFALLSLVWVVMAVVQVRSTRRQLDAELRELGPV